MPTVSKSRSSKSAKSKPARYIGKPAGIIQQRVESAGPSRFGVIAVDCAKQRSKWMLCDFFGKVLVEPTTVEHNAGALRAMASQIKTVCADAGIIDSIAAVEMTGIYHRPVQTALRNAGIDTRIVHPFASKHYRKPLHPDNKTDDNDLEAIFHAAINGFGLATLPVDDTYKSLLALARHRRNLVKQRSRLQTQIRALMHQTMPGFADLFEDDKLFNRSIAMPIAMKFSSAQAINKANAVGMAKFLKQQKIRFQTPTLDRIAAWAMNAVDPSDLAEMITAQWKQLDTIRNLLTDQIESTEREMAKFLVKTPYVLLLSVTGINVVSAATFAGEAGPIEHYASASALRGRAGLFPGRYQSDGVDVKTSVARNCNRRLRAAAMMIAENLIKCHGYYRGLSKLWQSQKVDPRDRRCRVANRAMRMVFQIVGGRQIWRGKGIDCESILYKLREFHRVHHSPLEQTVTDLNAAVEWLPKSSYASEAKPLLEMASKKRRGTKSIGDLLLPLMIRLGVQADKTLDSQSSEARET